MNPKLPFLALATAALAGPAAAQVPAFFDDFLFDNGGQPRENIRGQSQGDATGFFQWTVVDGTVDLVGGNIPGVGPEALGGRYVDLGGSSNDPGRFETLPITLTGVLTYNLSFLYKSADGSANSASVTIAGQTFNVSTSSTEFQTFSRDLTVDPSLSSTSIAFQDLGSTSDGIGIDRVQLLPAAVPEPATMAALGLGVFGFLRARRKRG